MKLKKPEVLSLLPGTVPLHDTAFAHEEIFIMKEI
jgi:hypothetical protein